MSAPLIWQSSNFGKLLTQLGLSLSDGKQYQSLTVDPSAGGGIVAPIGSIGVRDNSGTGEAWLKTGSGNTAWTKLGTGGGGAGTVTSVALSVPATSILGVTGSPVTVSGTLGLTTTGTSGGVPYFSSTSQLASSAALTANAITLGGGAGVAPASLGSLGTTTTVLHGNAAGAPTFGAVSLTGDVSGVLPVANGGTGANTLAAHGVVVGNGTTAVTLASPGTGGFVLTSNGASVDPTFQVAVASAPTNVYYSGYMAGQNWSTASTTFVDPTITGSNTLTQRFANGITVTAGASNVPGITFTPPSVNAVYWVSASLVGRCTTSGNDFGVQLTDGTTQLDYASGQISSAVPNASYPVKLSGLFAPATTSAVTVKVQLATTAGNAIIQDLGGFTGGTTIQWNVMQVK